MIPKILPDTYIAMHHTPLYNVYDICARTWTIDPLIDQEISGSITWIPGAMMSIAATFSSPWAHQARQPRGTGGKSTVARTE
ncbi:MAG: cytochrome c oxidase assembly protein [Sulfuricaulis sp.]